MSVPCLCLCLSLCVCACVSVPVCVCMSVVCVSGETFDDVIHLSEIDRLQEKSVGGSEGRAEGGWVCVRAERDTACH